MVFPIWIKGSIKKLFILQTCFGKNASHQVTNPWSPEHISQNICLEVPENSIWTYITSFEQFEDIFHPKAENFWYLAKKNKSPMF